MRYLFTILMSSLCLFGAIADEKLSGTIIGTELSINYETQSSSTDVNIKPNEGVKVTLVSPTEIDIEGIDKQAVGQTAARIREVRPPEPYLGKGIRYKDEHVVTKEGKRAGGKK